ncbi:MAG: L,D-transpeptidase family protein [Thermoleophilia bacterium]
MQVLGSRRGGLVTLVLVAVAIVAAATFAVFQLVGRPSVDSPLPAPGGATSEARPAITFSVPADTRLGDLKVTLDGRDVTARVRGDDGDLTLTPGAKLADGEHEVSVRFSSSNLFARTVSRDWAFTVDTAAPRLTVSAPKARSLQARSAVKFAGTAEPGATVTVASGPVTASTTAGGDGSWSVIARDLPDGDRRVAVTAADRAGNATEAGRRIVVDTTAPVLALTSPGKGEKVTATDAPLIYGTVRSDNPRLLSFTASVNGRRVTRAKGSDAATTSTSVGYTEASSSTPALQVDGKRFAISVGTLPQGRNVIEVTGRDAAGNLSTTKRVVLVDSTEEFGPADLVPGARGEDVKDLQTRMREAGVYPKRKAKITGRFDDVTEVSLERYQKRYKLPVTGVVDARTRSAMVGRIVVNLGQRKLRLIRNGKVWKTYGIAVGQPAYPTPTGTYEVNDKQVDPSWYPPDSPWAAELSTIPPGPGNPLGTRWIGTTAPAIGIHGTYADSSIGTAASHGCMRMHIPDVEELFEQVSLGMKVIIKP